MRKLFYILGATALFGFTGCRDDDKATSDAMAILGVWIQVEDAETGDNLLDPEVEGNILGQEIKSLGLRWEIPMESLEEALVNKPENSLLPDGLYWGNRTSLADPPSDYGLLYIVLYLDSTQFTIDWGDGTTTRFVCERVGEGESFHQILTMDGVEVTDSSNGHWRVFLKR